MMKPSVFAIAVCFSIAFVSPYVVARGGNPPQHLQLRRLVTTPDDATESGIFNDENGDGIPDGFPMFGGQGNTGIPGNSLPPGGFDWGAIDGGSNPFQNFDGGDIDWSNEDWQAFLDGLNGMPDFCPILESAMGIGQAFAVAGNCSCDGDLMEGLSVQCRFEECPESLACGTVGLNFTTEGTTGFIGTSVCVDFAADQYEEVCFSYQVDRVGQGDAFEPTCFASYGGNPCGCKMEDFCLAVDCSAYLPGAAMDTCQYLNFDQYQDTMDFFPRFPVFNESFDGTFAFENINWTNLDWGNVDWKNFDFDHIDWGNADWNSTQWGSLFVDTSSFDVCAILSARVIGMEDDFYQERCICDADSEAGFNVQCSFNEQCLPKNDADPIAIASQGTTTSSTTLCGNLTMGYKFDNLGSIGGSLCVDYAEDVHPTTCIEYSIPFADQNISPTCKATYGGKDCMCNIDENLCVKVDCSEHEATAVTTNCQNLEFTGPEDVPQLVPRFGVPSATSGADTGSSNEVQPGSDGQLNDAIDENTSLDPELTTENLNNESSSPTIRPSREQLGVFALIGASIMFALA